MLFRFDPFDSFDNLERRPSMLTMDAVRTDDEVMVYFDAPGFADEDVWRALRSLSRRQAEVLALVYVEDRPIAEVAAVLRLGEETVRTHLKRGRAALARRLRVDDAALPGESEVTA